MPEPASTRDAILAASRRIVSEGGTGALTFEAVARRLGVTKQAVIYWFPTKQDLFGELVAPWLAAEAEAVREALEGAADASDAIGRAVRAIIAFHLSDLDRFRHVYLAVQIDRRPRRAVTAEMLRRHVHPVTRRLYDALEAALLADPRADPRLRPPGAARRMAVGVHMAAIGLVVMVGLGAVLDDPLVHATEELTETLVGLLSQGPAPPAGR